MTDTPKQLWLPSPVTKQSNDISRSRFVRGSTIGFRVAVMVASMIEKTDTVLEEYEITANILHDYNLGGASFERMQKAMNDIASTQIAVLEGTKYEVYPLFGLARWDDATRRGTVRLNDSLKKHYIQVSKDFTMLPTDEFRRLTGVYAQILFQYLMSWRSEPETYIAIDELHKKLGTHNDELLTKDFNRFQKRILDLAQNQILKKTSLDYEWETKRGGRGNKVQGIRFVFSPGLIEKLRSPIHRLGNLSKKKQESWHRAFEKSLEDTPLANVLTDRESDSYKNSFNEWLKKVEKFDKKTKFPK